MIDVSKVAYNVYAVLQDGTRLNVTPAVMGSGLGGRRERVEFPFFVHCCKRGL